MGKSQNSKLPKFFCENCGKPVRRTSKLCPHCGRFFSSVKCPSCHYVGVPSEFSCGCPQCGYAVHSDPSKNTKENLKRIKKDTAAPYKTNRYNDPLPWWIYSLVFGMAAITLVMLILYY